MLDFASLGRQVVVKYPVVNQLSGSLPFPVDN